MTLRFAGYDGAMTAARVLGLSMVPIVAVACAAKERPSAPSAAPAVVTVASAPPVAPVESGAPASAPPAASASSGAPPSASPSPAAAAPEAPAVACKTADDCWLDDAKKPIKRPANLRGKKIVPCKDGEHAPACASGQCVVRAYKC